MYLFDELCTKIGNELDSIFKGLSRRIRSPSTKRTRLWCAYHKKREELLPLWQDIFTKMCLNHEDHYFLLQSVHQVKFEQMIANYFASECLKEPLTPATSLTSDELNAMRYACGYVPHKLLKKYEGRKQDKKHLQFIECLGNMAVTSEITSDLLSYTKKWIEMVNRGSLFPLNDETFILFIEIEKVVRILLPRHIKRAGSTQSITDLVKAVMENEDVQFNWALTSQDIESDEDAQELLHDIIHLWVTIRGFSIASTWMETYKLACKETKQKSTGLRKHLS